MIISHSKCNVNVKTVNVNILVMFLRRVSEEELGNRSRVNETEKCLIEPNRSRPNEHDIGPSTGRNSNNNMDPDISLCQHI